MSEWFARVGLPLTAEEHAAIGDLVRGAIPEARIAIEALPSWSDAARYLRLAGHDPDWWDQEEAEREALWNAAAEQRSEADLLLCVNAAAIATGAEIRAAARASARAAGVTDLDVAREASDMALLAVHHHALARLAGAGADHPFVRKYALFAGGRWPLGYHSARFAIF
ncbi:MAG TPA: hypothetical protein PLW68_11070 [Casimicrobiaceae bacterium]|nr:hypothetical protein [Casimicrobiaceae bacterium]